VTPALRPRLPSSESRLPLKPDVQGSWKTPVGDAFELTGLLPCAVHPAFTKVLGRPVVGARLREPNSVAVMGARSHHRKAADKRTATAGFCSLPRSIAEPFRCS
jgi:hypothetical protein